MKNNFRNDADAEAALKTWAFEHYRMLGFPAGNSDVLWSPILGDAGFRRYFRVGGREVLSVVGSEGLGHQLAGQNDSPSVIAVYAPVATENSQQFCRVAQVMREGGVHTPSILAHDFGQGFMLIEDLGGAVLLGELNNESVDGYYGEAMMSLLRIQQCRHDFSVFALYDADKLHTEMNLLPEWFVEKLLGVHLSSDEVTLLKDTFNQLINSALEQPQVVVHRDFHSRNLMCIESSDLGVIDFQDAVIGPVTYDLVSLLRDCYVAWDSDKVEKWALAYANMAVEVGVVPIVDSDTFIRWFDWMGLQRHIKVLGIFARLSLRDGKHRYLDDLPLVVQYVRSVAQKYAELQPFSEWFESRLMPEIDKTSWIKASDSA